MFTRKSCTHVTAIHCEVEQSLADHPLDLAYELTDGFAARYIRSKSRELVGLAGWTRSDRADIEQELRLALVQRFPQFDPAIAQWPAFVVTVVENAVRSLIAARRAEKRAAERQAESLDANAEPGSTADELRDLIGPDDMGRRTGAYQRSSGDQVDLALDVATVLAQSPDDLRLLAERLQHMSVTEAARELGLPRRTVRDQLARLRAAFSDFSENC